jgi:hypothetical protein
MLRKPKEVVIRDVAVLRAAAAAEMVKPVLLAQHG